MKLLCTLLFLLASGMVYSQFPFFIIGLLGHEPVKIQDGIVENLSKRLNERTLYYFNAEETKKLQKWYPDNVELIRKQDLPSNAIYLAKSTSTYNYTTEEYIGRGCPDDTDNYKTEHHTGITHTYYIIERTLETVDTLWTNIDVVRYKMLPKALYYEKFGHPVNNLMAGISLVGTDQPALELIYERKLSSKFHFISSVNHINAENGNVINTSFKLGGRYKQYRKWANHTFGWLIGAQFNLTHSDYMDIYTTGDQQKRGREQAWIGGWSAEVGHYLNLGRKFYLEGTYSMNVYLPLDPINSGHKLIGTGIGFGGRFNFGGTLRFGYRF